MKKIKDMNYAELNKLSDGELESVLSNAEYDDVLDLRQAMNLDIAHTKAGMSSGGNITLQDLEKLQKRVQKIEAKLGY